MTAVALPRQRLAAVLGMLGSDHDGEVLNAARTAERLRRDAGVTWQELLAPSPVKREPLHGTWRTTCAELAKRPNDLRPWERKFVADLPAFPRISTKQRYVLSEIAKRVLGETAP